MTIATRVQIPSYTSAFRRGERTGTVTGTGFLKGLGPDKKGRIEIARVRLDGSDQTILVDLNDCAVLS